MNQRQAKILIEKFHQGAMTDEDNVLLENYLEQGWIDLEDLESLNNLHKKLNLESSEIPTNDLRKDFYKNLNAEKEKINNISTKNWWSRFFPKKSSVNWSFGLAFLFAGILIGSLLRPSTAGDFEQISEELAKTREMMMFSLLEKKSSSERLKAVNLTQQMNDVSGQVVTALLQTLNNDDNVNVRLAAIEALSQYSFKASVRQGLIESIKNQGSPMVQLALAELMVQLQERQSVDAFQELFKNKEIPPEVKNQVEEKIKVLL